MKALSTLRRLAYSGESLADDEYAALQVDEQKRLEAAKARGWRYVACPSGCHNGLDRFAASYALAMGGDPGMATCDTCQGQGSVWVSPSGRLSVYPGQPFHGSLTLGEAVEERAA